MSWRLRMRLKWHKHTARWRCMFCGQLVRHRIRTNVEIPNVAPEPNSGPLIVDDLMCIACARMFGVEA